MCMATGPGLEPVWSSGPGDLDYAVSARKCVVYAASGQKAEVRGPLRIWALSRVDYTISDRSHVVRTSWSRSPHRLQTWPPGHTQKPARWGGYVARAVQGAAHTCFHYDLVRRPLRILRWRADLLSVKRAGKLVIFGS